MSIQLNHTILRAADKKKSAQFYRDIFGFDYKELFDGHFLAIRINDSLTLTSRTPTTLLLPRNIMRLR